MARLLLVDDDPVLRELLARLLSGGGHEVVTAQDGADCLVQFGQAGPFQAVITDIMMPGMDGYELTRALRAAPDGDRLRILLLTSGPRGPDREQALAAGADDFDVKTVNAGRLLARVHNLLAAPPPSGEQA